MSGEQALRTPGRTAQRRASSALRDLAEGQLLRSGEAVLVSAHSVVVLRWNDGREEQYGPRDVPLELQLKAPSLVAPVRGTSERSVVERTKADAELLRPLLPGLLAAVFALIALLLPSFPWLRHERGMRVLGMVLFVFLVLPVSLLWVAAQLSRMAWLQIPVSGASWTGVAGRYAHAANIAAFGLVLAGMLALWVLSVSLIFGGRTGLHRRHGMAWTLAGLMLAVASAGYLMPHVVNGQSAGWFHFWQGWARYYSGGVWLLLPFAHLLICRSVTPVETAPRARWAGVAASGALLLFGLCYVAGVAPG